LIEVQFGPPPEVPIVGYRSRDCQSAGMPAGQPVALHIRGPQWVIGGRNPLMGVATGSAHKADEVEGAKTLS
jgi:hypothetical protein